MVRRDPALSQHFLRSPALVAELVRLAHLTSADEVYDIGAGSGVITSALAKRCRSVVAVEVDPLMAAKLRENTKQLRNVRILQQDATTLKLPRSPYKVFANIPFSLSSQIVRKLFDAQNPPQVAFLIVQAQFARKLLPDNKGYTNQLGVELGAEFVVRVRRQLRPTDFYPHPNVPTVLLEIKRRPTPLLPAEQLRQFRSFVQACFTNPRHLWTAPLHAVGLPAIAAPSQLTFDDWLRLFAYMQDNPVAEGMELLPAADSLFNKAVDPVAQNEINAPHTRFLLQRMEQIVRRHRLAGLTAPQLGVNRQVITITDGHAKSVTVINPKLLQRSSRMATDIHVNCAQCGKSVAGYPQDVTVLGMATNGTPLRLQLRGLQAAIIVHFMEHIGCIKK